MLSKNELIVGALAGLTFITLFIWYSRWVDQRVFDLAAPIMECVEGHLEFHPDADFIKVERQCIKVVRERAGRR
jgi:hypothetical protein